MALRLPPLWQLVCVSLTLLVLLVGFSHLGPESPILFFPPKDGELLLDPGVIRAHPRTLADCRL